MTSCSYHIIFLLPGADATTRNVKGSCELDAVRLDSGAFEQVIENARDTDPDLADAAVLSTYITRDKP